MRPFVVVTNAVLAVLLLAGCGAAHTVSPADMLAFEVSVASAPDALAVAWHGGTGGHDAIWLESLDTRGRSASNPVRITDGRRDAYEPDLQWLEGDAVLAWYEKDATGGLRAWLGRFDLRGHAKWQVPLTDATRRSRNPVVRIGAGGIHVAWLESVGAEVPVVRAAVFDADGQVVRTAFDVAPASAQTWNLNAALGADGTFFVVFDAKRDSRAKEIHLARIGANDVMDVRLGDDDGFDSTYPDIGLDGERAAITWFDQRDGNAEVYLAVGSIPELTSGLAQRSQRITRTPGASIGAYLAWNASRLEVAWCDDGEGQDEIYRQEFDSRGAALTPIERMTDTPTDSLIPAVRPFREGFVIAWTERHAQPSAGETHAGTGSSRVRVELVH